MRIEQITFTRFIAAIFIFIFHFGKQSFPFSNPFLFPFLKQATVGVSYFFMLSGFVMIIAYWKLNTNFIPVKQFLASRFARIYPVYIIAILLSVVFVFLKNGNISATAFLLEIFALQSWIPQYALEINYTAWSISVEMFFFLSFPFLYKYFYKRYSLSIVVITAIVFWLLSQIIFNYAYFSGYYQPFPSSRHSFLYYHPIMHWNEFILGNATGLIFIKFFANKNYNRNFDWILLCFPVLVALMLRYKYANYHNGLLAVLFIPFIVLLSLNTGWITKIFCKPFFVLLGEISYSIYILQLPVYWACKSIFIYFHINTSKYSLFYVTAVILLISAYISYRFLETPLRIYLNKKLIKKSPLLPELKPPV